jgi:hypothetical protein
VDDDVGDLQPAARPQHSKGFAKDSVLVEG